MRSVSRFLCSAAAVLGCNAVADAATTAPVTFDVTLTIVDECTTVAPSTLVFGNVGVIVGTETATTTVAVHCTTGTGYNIGLDGGLNGDTTTRVMVGPQPAASSSVSYKLFQDNTYSTNWGNAVGSDTKSGTGNGAVQNHTVYGKLIVQNSPVAGDYLDTITLVVTY
ncbi:MAG: spore coat U domain-containing protein [Bauldia sp.]